MSIESKNKDYAKWYSSLTDRDLTLSNLLIVVMTDIDTFLLMEENQIDDKQNLFSKEEVREQLKNTQKKILSMLMEFGFDIDLPLLDALTLKKVFDNEAVSNKEILRLRQDRKKLK